MTVLKCTTTINKHPITHELVHVGSHKSETNSIRSESSRSLCLLKINCFYGATDVEV